jgi:hypothetical protein
MAICENCPLNAVFDVTEQTVELVNHNNPAQVMGGVAISREILSAISDKIDCPEPMRNQNNMIDCPLREMMFTARSFALTSWPPGQLAVKLEDGIDSSRREEQVEKTEGHGIYL